MPDNTPKTGQGKAVANSAKSALNWLENYGIVPVPLSPGTKRPKAEDGKRDATGWQRLRVTKANIQKYFKPDDNIGGLWGEPSNWVVDIDLDTPEAIIVARHYLPETFVYGREGAQSSHYLFRCENAVTRKYQDKEVGTVVEIRSTGTQSVLPPSIHPSGERYKRYHDVDIAEIRWSNLESRIKKIAAAALVAHYYPDKGSRHDYVHALTGALLWSKWQDDEVRKFVNAVIEAGGGHDGETKDRVGSVENTIEHFHKGNRVQGWPSLSAFMPGITMVNLQRWLSMKRVMTDNSEVAPDSISAEPVLKMKDKLYRIPGLVGDIAHWAAKQSQVKQPLFDIAAGLMSVALASGNKYLVDAWKTPLQPYMMLLAPTASGKESAAESVMDVASVIGLRNNVVSGLQSYHAMLDLLSKPPHIVCWQWNEAARKLKSAGKAQGGQDNSVITYLIEMYGKANKVVGGIPGRKSSIEAIEHPFFVVMAAAQPNQLLEAITVSDLSMGLINRFLLLDAGGDMARVNNNRDDHFPNRIKASLEAMQKVQVDRERYPKGFLPVGMTNDAFEIFSDFSVAARENAAKEESHGEMWGRANQNALIYAGLIAVGCDFKEPIIDATTAQWAVEFVSWSVERWITRIDQSASRTVTEQASKNIERLVRGVRALKDKCKNSREVELVAKGKMPRALLTRLCRHLKARDLDDILVSLHHADIVGASDEDGIDCYWIKQVVKKVTLPPGV